MKLFDESHRTEDNYPLYAEPEFRYLNRSARSELSVVREELESWFAPYPDKHKPDLRSRFRSDDDWGHRSAFFELLLHALLLRFGYEVDVHTEPPDGRGRKPDFLVRASASEAFYLEATVPMFQSAV